MLERGDNFSAGERQLIAFARALYRDPPILILDEATANVDSDTEARLQRALDGAMKGRTALIIAHRLSTIRAVDRIVVFHKGRVVEQGTHEALLAAGGLYAQAPQPPVRQGGGREEAGARRGRLLEHFPDGFREEWTRPRRRSAGVPSQGRRRLVGGVGAEGGARGQRTTKLTTVDQSWGPFRVCAWKRK